MSKLIVGNYTKYSSSEANVPGRIVVGSERLWKNVVIKAFEDIKNDPDKYLKEVADMVFGEDFELICHHADLPFEETKTMFIREMMSLGYTEEINKGGINE